MTSPEEQYLKKVIRATWLPIVVALPFLAWHLFGDKVFSWVLGTYGLIILGAYGWIAPWWDK